MNRVVCMGSGGVGKSALVFRFVSGTFVEKYDPTIEDFYRKEIDIDGSPEVLEILDTAGSEQFASMRDLYIKNALGFLVVYSIINGQSFIDIQSLRDQIIRVKGSAVQPIILIANKCDLEEYRSVCSRDGQMLASEWGCPFFETSAKKNINIGEAFVELVRQMKIIQKQKDGSCCVLL